MDNGKLLTKDIEELLINKQFYCINVEQCVDSTNNEVKRYAEKGEKEGLVIIANEQTAGKGRLGRSFYSPKNTGIYMSILLRPEKEANKSLIITSAAAISVCKAIREIVGVNVNIKWVNDIMLENKKVCGILTEGKVDIDTTKLDYAILGIGINISEPENGFPEEINDIATTLFEKMDVALRNKLISKILDNFYFYYNDIDLQEEIIRYDYISMCGIIGKEVVVINGSETEEAKAVGIAEDMSLIVRNDKGLKFISCGEISVKEKIK